MVKVLVFDDDDRSRHRFGVLYQGLCQSEKTHKPRDLETLKREGRLRTQLEAISQADVPAGVVPKAFTYVGRDLRGPATIEVDQADLQLLKDYILACSWTTMIADVVADAVEWAWGAPEKPVGG